MIIKIEQAAKVTLNKGTEECILTIN